MRPIFFCFCRYLYHGINANSSAAPGIAQWKVKTIVLWCCNIGRNKDFVKALENIAGAEVFASTEVINQLQITTKNKKGKTRNLDTLLKQGVISRWKGELSATQRGDDIDGKAQGDRSGWSVSLSADGNTLAVGARQTTAVEIDRAARRSTPGMAQPGIN